MLIRSMARLLMLVIGFLTILSALGSLNMYFFLRREASEFLTPETEPSLLPTFILMSFGVVLLTLTYIWWKKDKAKQ